jgi:hypothetical protein
MGDEQHAPSSRILFFAIAALSLVAAFGTGLLVGAGNNTRIEERSDNIVPEKLSKLYLRWDPENAQYQDAARRWAQKTDDTVGEVRQAYVPIGISVGAKDCVQLVFPDYSVGGQPTYCYRAGTIELVEEHTDEE